MIWKKKETLQRPGRVPPQISQVIYWIAIYSMMVLVLLLGGCGNQDKTSLEIAGGLANTEVEMDPALVREATDQIRTVVLNHLNFIRQKDIKGIEGQVVKTGVFIDLKARKDFENFRTEIQDPDSYLHALYFDTDRLAVLTQDSSQKSIKDLLDHNPGLGAEIYLNRFGDGAEVQLQLLHQPGESYRLNHGYLVKIGTDWKFLRLF